MTKILKKKVVERSVLDLAYERLHHAFDLYDTIDVSFSGGKDSTACLNLTLDVARERGRLPLRVFFFDEEAIPYQTEEYVRRVSHSPEIELEWYCLPVQHRNACSRRSPFWSPWDPTCPELWVRDLPPEGITTVSGFRTDGTPGERLTMPDTIGLLHDPQKYGTIGMVMGIRGQESLVRQRAVSMKREENYLIHFPGGTSQGNIWKVYPIYDWQTEDVWTAPKLFNWDYNHAYDVMDQAGVSPYHQRCSPAYGEEPMKGFNLYKQCFPEVWDKMSTRVPGANTALLYARTEVYGFRDLLMKPDHLSWEEYVLGYVSKFSPETAPKVAENVRKMIALHYGKTTDPILSQVDHPLSGISWRRLLNIAMRGDFKDRRSASILSRSAPQEAITASRSKFGKDDPAFIEEFIQNCWNEYNEARKVEGL